MSSSTEYSILESNSEEDDTLLADDASIASQKSVDVIPDGGVYAWLQVVAAFCISLSTWGVINMYGVFQTYYTETLLQHESQSNIAWIGSLQGGLLLVVCFCVGPVYDAGYSTELVCLGTFLNVLGMVATSFCSKYWQLLLAQGFAVGIGSGLLYLPGIGIISQYFKAKRGFAFGISSLGSSIGGILFPIVFRQLQPLIGFGWETRAFALIQLATLIVPVIWMRPRRRPATLKKLLDPTIFRDGPFFIFVIGMFFGYMGVYITYCYIELYALKICSTPANLAAYILAITNTGSLFGRVIPNYLADDYLGPMNVHIIFTLIATILAFSWIAVKDTVGLIVFVVLDGFFSGTFVSLGGPIIFSLTPDLDTVGTRLGIVTGVSGIGLMIGNPIAGAILDRGSWIGLQVWAASLGLGAALLISWARIARFGPQVRLKV